MNSLNLIRLLAGVAPAAGQPAVTAPIVPGADARAQAGSVALTLDAGVLTRKLRAAVNRRISAGNLASSGSSGWCSSG